VVNERLEGADRQSGRWVGNLDQAETRAGATAEPRYASGKTRCRLEGASRTSRATLCQYSGSEVY
jgi:hypothetical protein